MASERREKGKNSHLLRLIVGRKKEKKITSSPMRNKREKKDSLGGKKKEDSPTTREKKGKKQIPNCSPECSPLLWKGGGRISEGKGAPCFLAQKGRVYSAKEGASRTRL